MNIADPFLLLRDTSEGETLLRGGTFEELEAEKEELGRAAYFAAAVTWFRAKGELPRRPPPEWMEEAHLVSDQRRSQELSRLKIVRAI